MIWSEFEFCSKDLRTRKMMIKNQFYKKSECLITEGAVDFIFRTISLRKLVQRYENIPRSINSTKIQMLRKQEVDGSYLSIKWAGAAASSLHSSHWSFPARVITISSGYDQYYRYYLLLLFDYHFFLIIISYNQFYISLQKQLSFPRDYYQYINISMLSFLGKVIIILSW